MLKDSRWSLTAARSSAISFVYFLFYLENVYISYELKRKLKILHNVGREAVHMVLPFYKKKRTSRVTSTPLQFEKLLVYSYLSHLLRFARPSKGTF